MKTCLFALCYVDGQDALGNDRLVRNQRYLEYYRRLKTELGFEQFQMVDNGSDLNRVVQLGGTVCNEDLNILHHGKSDLLIKRFNQHIPRGPRYDYGYNWRGLYEIKNLIAAGYEKIICIDTDGFVLSKRLAEHIRNCNSGWETFLCRVWRFPDSAIHILNKDTFDRFLDFTDRPWSHYNGRMMETELPFTKVNHDFVTGRFGETFSSYSPFDCDYWGQAAPAFRPEFDSAVPRFMPRS